MLEKLVGLRFFPRHRSEELHLLPTALQKSGDIDISSVVATDWPPIKPDATWKLSRGSRYGVLWLVCFYFRLHRLFSGSHGILLVKRKLDRPIFRSPFHSMQHSYCNVPLDQC